MVYYFMINFAGCIEGVTVNTGASDLKSRNSERFDARLHGAGINDEENAGQRNNTDGRYGVGISPDATSRSGGRRMVCRNLGNPCVEKGMHTRSQQLFFSRSRMGNVNSDAHARGVAVAQRLHSDFILEVGRPACKCESFKGWGANEVAPPRLQSFL